MTLPAYTPQEARAMEDTMIAAQKSEIVPDAVTAPKAAQTQAKIIEFMVEHGKPEKAENIALGSGVSDSTTRKHLAHMAARGVVKQETWTGNRAATWVVGDIYVDGSEGEG